MRATPRAENGKGTYMLQGFKCVSVSVLALVPALALAQEGTTTTEGTTEAAAAPAAAAAAGPALKLTPRAQAQVFSTLSTSEGKGFGFDVKDARFGADGEYGVAKFKLQLSLPGDKAVSEVGLYEAKVGFSTWLGTLNTGRIRNQETLGYGLWDERFTPGFGAIDGIQLATAHEFGPAKVSAGVTLGNGLDGTWLGGKTAGLKNGSAEKTDLSTVLTLGVEAAGAKVYAGLGMEPNRFVGQDDSKTPDTDETFSRAADLTHAEIAVGYGMEGINGGLWYAVTTTDESKAVKENKGGAVSTTGDSAKDKQDLSMLGLGVTVDSRLWGMTGLLQDGDRLAFGLNYAMFTPKVDGDVAEDGAGKELSDNELAISAGYNAADVYNMNLHFVMTSSDAKKFKDSDGVDGKEDSKTRIVLETGLYL